MPSRGLAKAQIVGNVGQDAELRYLPSGAAVATFSVAVGRVAGQGDQRQEETDWYRVTAWGKLAEIAGEFVVKGQKVFVDGRLATRKYTDRQGVERISVEITAQDLLLLGTRGAARQNARRTNSPMKPNARSRCAKPWMCCRWT